MELITSAILESFVNWEKKKTEGILPELIKRLIISGSSDITKLRIPGLDDVWAPGFDGVVNTQEGSAYVAKGTSVWEIGTNSDTLQKINSDYKKRTENSLGIDKPETTFYLVTPRIWAFDNQGTSVSKWEANHSGEWKNVHIYDASVLCDWINSEPSVCAWLFEQYGEKSSLNFSSVQNAWEKFSNQTVPALTPLMFTEGRKDQIVEFSSSINQKTCCVGAETFQDAYGFCLSVLLQCAENANGVIVVNTEDTYFRLTREIKGKTLLLSFPYTGQVSDYNHTIRCFSKQNVPFQKSIKLPALWKTQFISALQDMGISDAEASAHYAFTHGNILSLIRRIPGNASNTRPRWAEFGDIDCLHPMIFLRHYCITNELDKIVIGKLAGIPYDSLEEKYESFLRLEDAPIKKVDDQFVLVNYEEAWLTLNVDIHSGASSRLYNVLLSLLDECKDFEKDFAHPQASIIRRLLYNYIYFSETGSDENTINQQAREILKYAKISGCKDVIFKSLSIIAEAAPAVVIEFIESELDNGVVSQAFNEETGWSGDYCNVLWALDKITTNESCAIRACKALYQLCKIPKDYSTANSLTESLLNALCLWDNHAALTTDEKADLANSYIREDPAFGIPFAIKLISKRSVSRGVRIGEKEHRYEAITIAAYRSAVTQISSELMTVSIDKKRIDWIEKAFEDCWRIPCDVLNSSADRFCAADYSPEQLLSLVFQIKSHIYHVKKYKWVECEAWIAPLEKWIAGITTEDPISIAGWMFYKHYHAPFEELLDIPRESYMEERNLIEKIRESVFARIYEGCGAEAIIRLACCMEDEYYWGVFLAKNTPKAIIIEIAKEVKSAKKKAILSGMLNTLPLPEATEIFLGLSLEERKTILPALQRGDIGEWLTSPEMEESYWKTKLLYQYEESAYRKLLKYNPCGILSLFFSEENSLNNRDMVSEVISAIAACNELRDTSLLVEIVQKYDKKDYSDNWAELCLQLYNRGAFKQWGPFYPDCLRIYFFRHPEQICKALDSMDGSLFRDHFHYNYCLPNEAYNDYNLFLAWSDYLYEKSTDDSELILALSSIFGRSIAGKDGIFPHEFVRSVLERYSDKRLTTNAAFAKINSFGGRCVQDGLHEKKVAEEYRKNARRVELNYPQTAEILRIIASHFEWESKSDRQESELFPI